MKPLFYSLVVVLALGACSQTSDTTTTTAEATSATASETMTAPAAATDTTPTAAPAGGYENKVAEIQTTAGDIHIRFFPQVAPNHVKNFIDLAQSGFYEGIKFHRIIPGFMIQAGDPNTIKGDPSTWGSGGAPNKLRAEFNAIPHKRGIISAARTNDPNSASSQFFVVVADSNFLDNKYTVFGEVTKGMDVADKIVNAPASSERPINPVSITRITIRDARPDEQGPLPQ